MTLLSSGQKTKERADGHKSTYYLSVCRPTVLLVASVNEASPARGETVIDYDLGVSTLTSRIREGVRVKIIINGLIYVTRLKNFSFAGSSPNLSGQITADNNSIPWINN